MLAHIAGRVCPECGRGLREPGVMRLPGEGLRVTCDGCCTALRILPARPVFARWLASKLPLVALAVAGYVVVEWLFAPPRKDPALVSVVVLAIALLLLPASFATEALGERIRRRVVRDDQ